MIPCPSCWFWPPRGALIPPPSLALFDLCRSCSCHRTHLAPHLLHYFFVKSDVFRQCQLDTSCRSRRELSNAIVNSIFVLQVSRYGRFRFGKGSCMGNLQGEAGGSRGTEPGEPRGAAVWSLHINKNSKNPSKQSLVKETIVTYECAHTFLCLFNTFFEKGTCPRRRRLCDRTSRQVF